MIVQLLSTAAVVRGLYGPQDPSGRHAISHHHRDSIPRSSSPWPVAVSAKLSWPLMHYKVDVIDANERMECNEGCCDLVS